MEGIAKYRSLIFFLVHVILSLLLPLLFINAISLNTGKAYSDVFMEAYGPAWICVFAAGFGLLIAVGLMGSHLNIFSGRGGFAAAVAVYVVGAAILIPVAYFGLLNFGK